MIISEKQVMQLINVAAENVHKIEIMISMALATGSPEIVREQINKLLVDIRNQQSEELKVIE